MKVKLRSLIIVFVTFLMSCTLASCDENERLWENQTFGTFYTAGVLEYNSPLDTSDILLFVNTNLEEYIKWIEKAANSGVDILSFPERTLNYIENTTRFELSKVAVDLQNIDIPDVTECFYDAYDNIVSELSFAASNNSIYVLVNVIEIENCSNEQSHCSYDGFNLYNTNLVFDRNGCIISKYRKFNLFNEPLINVTSQPDISTFSTDFGVTFGQFNGFDILFKSPAWDLVNANISHFLYPSMKNSFYPFLTNLQVQQGFAVSNDVVLLSAGGNSPDNSYTGSGIFVGKHGAVQKFISSNSVSKLLVAEIPINVDDSDYQSPEMNSDNSTKIMNRITFINTNDGHFYDLDENLEVHYDEIICKFKVNYTELEIEEDKIGFSYKIVIFNGVKDLMNNEIGEVFCAIVACLDSTCAKLLHENSLNLVPSVKFESIEIEMEIDNYNSDEFLMMPSSLSFGMLPLNKDDFEFSSKENIFETTLTSEIDNLLTFGIYGRNLKLDEKCNDENDENSNEKQDEIIKVSDVHEAVGDLTIKMTVYIVLMIVLSIITTIMVYKKLQQPSFDESITNKRKN